uniref:E74-like factor 3 (ets domain transcription factor, epithelial-specific ) n=1 Tax=Poecilia reticulata TaxID=8081 RepID=A0A3P9Q4L8_POERE
SGPHSGCSGEHKDNYKVGLLLPTSPDSSSLDELCVLCISPHQWTAEHVLEWISDHVERTKFDASTLSLDFCSIDGPNLCRINQEEMTAVFGPQLGPHLYQSLEEYKTKYEKTWNNTSIYHTGEEAEIKRNFEYPDCCPFFAAPRGTHLWEFIRDILIHPEKNQGLMKWEDRREGVFKFLKSEAVAQMWGQKKKNTSMTYEKLSRAMRYYYKREILERVDGRRLVYKFGKNSSGWKTEEIGSGIGGVSL